MSLEAAVAELNSNVVKLCGLLETSNAGREAAIAAAEKLATGGDAPKATRKKKDEPAAGAAAPEKPAGPPSVDEVREAFGTYMGVDDAAERDARKVYVKKILEKFGVGKATEITEGNRAEAIALVKQLTAGEVPAEFADEAAEEEEDGLI